MIDRLKCLGLVVLLPLACLSAAPALAQPEASVAAMEARSLEIARTYLRVWSSDGGAAIADVPYVYGPRVHFYGRDYSHGALIAEKRRAMARWPERDYRHRPGTMRAVCNAATRKCVVRSTMDWRVANAARRTAARGSSRFDLGISFAGPKPVILFESSRMAGR